MKAIIEIWNGRELRPNNSSILNSIPSPYHPMLKLILNATPKQGN